MGTKNNSIEFANSLQNFYLKTSSFVLQLPTRNFHIRPRATSHPPTATSSLHLQPSGRISRDTSIYTTLSTSQQSPSQKLAYHLSDSSPNWIFRLVLKRINQR